GYLVPGPAELHAPGARVGRRIAHEPAGLALAHDEPVGARVLVELLPLAVVVGDDQRHAAVLDWLRHQRLLFYRRVSAGGAPAPRRAATRTAFTPDEQGAAGARRRPSAVSRGLGGRE